jgi:hypothetical protein
MRVGYNINKVQDTSYPLAQYGLLDVHSPVAPGLTTTTTQHDLSIFAKQTCNTLNFAKYKKLNKMIG